MLTVVLCVLCFYIGAVGGLTLFFWKQDMRLLPAFIVALYWLSHFDEEVTFK